MPLEQMRALVEAVVAAMNDVPAEVSPARFESLKRRLMDEYENAAHDDAYRQVRYAHATCGRPRCDSCRTRG